MCSFSQELRKPAEKKKAAEEVTHLQAEKVTAEAAVRIKMLEIYLNVIHLGGGKNN